ncbi:5-oxoprolinase subunit B family protein [Actinoalloteichus hymeniacidonis]|uniref:Allophanate hydrolase subunit 1 n=1 Tax=Actinoalloteichus hymeniacidonis TaxID=340345 RepID=A0AAC9HNX0_9PSEU|nr:allophanate hydrolase subunit 1 [Actinoalloteichus hymeniacidonis]AOS62718.1 allophanate hydrolase subunit 1 [Actinoalloteichus hymeniacidonis]MBB5909251.1 KipI family sensor histidine kinase inhibitor [Actinoalloteichus hymeniacidonis]
MTYPRILPVGRSALLVELADLDAVQALHHSLTTDHIDGTTEIVPAARTVLVAFDPRLVSAELLAEAVRSRDPAPLSRTAGESIEVPVTYGGPDLAAVAELAGLSEQEVVRRHSGGDYRVAFCGFAPGFGYLVGGDPALRVPRRETPRVRVPGGSVAIADEFTAVYPRDSPGGWQLLGHTELELWHSDRPNPALLAPGDRVRFREA